MRRAIMEDVCLFPRNKLRMLSFTILAAVLVFLLIFHFAFSSGSLAVPADTWYVLVPFTIISFLTFLGWFALLRVSTTLFPEGMRILKWSPPLWFGVFNNFSWRTISYADITSVRVYTPKKRPRWFDLQRDYLHRAFWNRDGTSFYGAYEIALENGDRYVIHANDPKKIVGMISSRIGKESMKTGGKQ